MWLLALALPRDPVWMTASGGSVCWPTRGHSWAFGRHLPGMASGHLQTRHCLLEGPGCPGAECREQHPVPLASPPAAGLRATAAGPGTWALLNQELCPAQPQGLCVCLGS